jgi:hypothetical protein
MLVLLLGIRKALDFVFDSKELKVLDDILPASKRTEILDLEELIEDIAEEPEEEVEQGVNHRYWRKDETAAGEEAGGEGRVPEDDNIIHIKMKGIRGTDNSAYSPDILKMA